jgi:hypothetical protein
MLSAARRSLIAWKLAIAGKDICTSSQFPTYLRFLFAYAMHSACASMGLLRY